MTRRAYLEVNFGSRFDRRSGAGDTAKLSRAHACHAFYHATHFIRVVRDKVHSRRGFEKTHPPGISRRNGIECRWTIKDLQSDVVTLQPFTAPGQSFVDDVLQKPLQAS